MSFDVEYYEYDCGRPCTPDGCPGHGTDIPVAIEVNGVTFHVDGAERGDYPSSGDKEYIKEVQDAVETIRKALAKAPPEPLDVEQLGNFVDHYCSDGSLQTTRLGEVCQLCGYGSDDYDGGR